MGAVAAGVGGGGGGGVDPASWEELVSEQTSDWCTLQIIMDLLGNCYE